LSDTYAPRAIRHEGAEMIYMTDKFAPSEIRREDTEVVYLTDASALRAIRRGDTEALELLIDRYSAYVGTVVFNIIGYEMSREDVEEVTSDVFVTLWRNADKPDGTKLKAWLGAVSRNAAKKKYREVTGHLPLEDEYFDIGGSDDIEHELIVKEEARIIRRAIQTMTPPDDKIFLLHYYWLQPVSQISEVLGLSVSAIKMRLSRGREKLRATLEKGGISR